MVTSKRLLVEQVLDLLKGGDPSAQSSIEFTVVEKTIEQLINASLKVDFFAVQSPSGETIPDGLVLATYEGVTVERYKKTLSRVKLPAIPIALPKGMGVFFVGPHVANIYLIDPVFTVTGADTTYILLQWATVPNATNYFIEKSIDVLFTVPIPLYSGLGLTYSDNGLTASTQYWYRIKASATGYNDSNVIIGTGITLSGTRIFNDIFDYTFG